MKTPRFIQMHRVADAALADEATTGLLAQPAQVSPKFFYDALGSRLFDAITELKEYYPTRTEAAIFTESGSEMAAAALSLVGAAPVLVDLGAGNCAKAARLFPLLAPRRYVAVDISAEYLHQALHILQREHPTTELMGVGMDFSTRLVLPAEAGCEPKLVFYPGSSIGNFDPDAALRLLQQARAVAAGGALLIGVDLMKPTAILEAAYDDELGVTAAFNLNLLKHLNKLLDANFAVQDWRHVALFDAVHSRIEMHLEARHSLQVQWRGGERHFAAGERMHTENSYKWAPADFEALLLKAGFRGVQRWTDGQGWFGLFLAGA